MLSANPWRNTGGAPPRPISAPPENRSRVRNYVVAVSVAALVIVAMSLATSRPPSSAEWRASLVLAGIVVAAEHFLHAAARGGGASIAAIPILGIVLVAPPGCAVVAAGFATAVVQLTHRRAAIKSVFNVAQVLLAVGAASLVYHLLGGPPYVVFEEETFWNVTLATVGPAAVAMMTFLVVNAAAVAGVLGLAQGRPVVEMWRTSALPNIPYALVSLVLAIYLVTLYSKLGVLGAVGLTAPMLAVRQLYKSTADLTRLSQDLLDVMVAAIEARDPYTSGHSKRVSQGAKVIAEALGIRGKALERVIVAALLHDVGKIYEMYAAILAKPGRMTNEEREMMETHPVKSAELVDRVDALKDLVPSIRAHHEAWDGTGYPDKLQGENIPLFARIIAVSDTIDAMSSARPYRTGLPPEVVREEIRRCAGTQFEPRIANMVSSPEFWPRVYTGITGLPVLVREEKPKAEKAIRLA